MASELLTTGDGRSFALERFGAAGGVPALYFHGLPGSRLDLVSAADVFAAAGVELIAIDRPGFGGSSARRGRTLLDWTRDVEWIAGRLGLGRFGVLGYSSGGKYALACGAALAERVTVAVVVAGTGPPELPGFRASLDSIDRISLALAAHARPLAHAFWGLARALLRHRPQRFLAQLEKGLAAPDRELLADPSRGAALLATLSEGLRPGVGGVLDDYVVEGRTWGFALENVRVPVKIWHGDADTLVPLEHSRYLAARLPEAELTVLAGSGHLIEAGLEPVARALAAAV